MAESYTAILNGMECIIPNCMGKAEAGLYAQRAKRKYGESNVRGVKLEVKGDVVTIHYSLVHDPRERLRRPSIEMVEQYAGGY